jgi:hypothetical protein
MCIDMPSPLASKLDNIGSRFAELVPSMKGGFLTNKWILYVVLFSAIFDVFNFYQKNDIYAVAIFFIVGFLVSFFSKNMVVILIVAIVMTHLIRYGKNLSEGFEELEEEGFEEDEEKEGFEEHDKEEGFEEDEDKEGFEEDDKEEGFEEDEDKEGFEELEDEGFEDDKEEEGFEEDDKEGEGFNSKKMIRKTNADVDKALKNTNINASTQGLINAQKQIMKNMKTLEPMLSKAENFLSQKHMEKFTNYSDAYGK